MPEPQDEPGTTDPGPEARRRAAVHRLADRAGFRVHLLAYALVMALLVGIWGLDGGGLFWPFYPLAGWGVGVALHGYSIRLRAPTEVAVRAELLRMARHG